MKKIKVLLAAVAVLALGVFVFAPVETASALDPLATICADNPESEVCKSKEDDANVLIGVLVNTLLFIVGTLSVIMIIAGGIFYAISNGDAGRIAKAKNTIVYAVVGLIVSLVAFAIVNWVLDIF